MKHIVHTCTMHTAKAHSGIIVNKCSVWSLQEQMTRFHYFIVCVINSGFEISLQDHGVRFLFILFVSQTIVRDSTVDSYS